MDGLESVVFQRRIRCSVPQVALGALEPLVESRRFGGGVSLVGVDGETEKFLHCLLFAYELLASHAFEFGVNVLGQGNFDHGHTGICYSPNYLNTRAEEQSPRAVHCHPRVWRNVAGNEGAPIRSGQPTGTVVSPSETVPHRTDSLDSDW